MALVIAFGVDLVRKPHLAESMNPIAGTAGVTLESAAFVNIVEVVELYRLESEYPSIDYQLGLKLFSLDFSSTSTFFPSFLQQFFWYCSYCPFLQF